MASTSRWFVGSSSRSRLTRRDWSSARCARVRSPGESVEHARPTCSAPRPNFASKVRAASAESSVRSQKASSSGAAVPYAPRLWPSSPILVLRPTVRRPMRSGSSSESTASRVDFPLPLRLADLRLQGVGRPAIGAPGALAERVSLPARLGASFREELRDVPAAIDRLLVLGIGGATLGLPSGGVVGPATGPLVHAVGRRLDLDDPAHDAIE